jgi:hypothetical protein
MIGRLLCAIGYHRWQSVQFVYASWFECARCHATHAGRTA